jgi:hypothetical protein
MIHMNSEMTLAELEKHVQRMEDIQEIENLQKIYGYYFETGRLQEVVDLFSEDNTESVEITDHGLFKGKQGVKKMYLEWMGGGGKARPPMRPGVGVCIMQLQGVVEVAPDGRTAKGRWNCLDFETRPWGEGLLNSFLQGYYENEYIKENGKWFFKKLHWNDTFWTPYADGWLKTPLVMTMDYHETIKADAPSTAFHPYPSGYHLPYSFKHPITGE